MGIGSMGIESKCNLRAALFAGAAIVLLGLPAAQAKVGVTSQTTNNPLGTPPQQQQRTLKVGIDVFANERIQTTANDRAHLLFLDGSSLTVGPNADLFIDKYVYDPNTGTGELAVSATKGIFRLVGGRITKSNEATIKVGTSTIGIRGGITIVNAPECPPGTAVADCLAQAYFMFGQQLSVTNANGSQTAFRPGSMIAFSGGLPPLPPVIVPPNSLIGPIAQLEAPTGQGDTGPSGPGTTIEQATANSGLPASNSGALVDPTNGAPLNAQIASSVTGAGSALTNTPDPNAPPTSTPPTSGSSEPPPPPPPPPPPVTVISAEGRFVRQSEFASASFDAFSTSAPRDPVNNAYIASATITEGRLTVTSESGFSAELPWQPGFEFDVTDGIASDSGSTLTGRGLATTDGEDFYFYFYRVRETDTDGRRNIIFGGTPTPLAQIANGPFSAYNLSTLAANEAPFLSEFATSLPVVADAVQGDLYVASASLTPGPSDDARATWFQATLNIQGQGEDQSSYLSIATGVFATDETKGNTPYAAGAQQAFIRESAFVGPTKYGTDVATAETQNGSAIYGPGGAYMVLVPERVTYDGSVTTRTPSVGAALPFDTLELTDINYPVSLARVTEAPPDLGTVRTAETLHGFAGALVENNNDGWMSSYVLRSIAPDQVSITKLPATNRVEGQFGMNVGGHIEGEYVTLDWGGLTGAVTAQSSAFIDDRRFAMRQSDIQGGSYDGESMVTQISMVTQAAVPDADFLPAGVSFCECSYLTWGYWQGDLNYISGDRAGQRDYVTLGTWVTGNLAASIDIPLTGTATYSGHIIGNVENEVGNSYVAVGNFSNAWNFGTESGDISITNFDGADYSGTAYADYSKVRFSGYFSGLGPASDRSGSLNGAFFRSPTDPVAYQAGSFQIESYYNNYKAAGTFQGVRSEVDVGH